MLKQLFILVFCTGHLMAQSKNGFVLKGTIEGLKDNVHLYLVRHANNDTVAKSISKAGTFFFKGRVSKGAEFYFIKSADTSMPKRVSNALLLVNSYIKVNGSIAKWQKLNVSGSVPHSEYIEVIALLNPTKVKIEEIGLEKNNVYSSIGLAKEAGDSNKIQELNFKMKQLEEEQEFEESKRNELIENYIRSHSNSLYVGDLISKMEPVFQVSGMQREYDRLGPKAKESYFGMELRNRLVVGNIEPGKVIGDFTKKMPNGAPLSLKEVLGKGKFTLLDFWASWCVPCREETPFIRNVYKKYHDKGLNILSITVDTNLEAWKRAIVKDTMPWYHVADTKELSIKEMFKVNSIPATFLLDKQGEIIAINLRGEELARKIKELMAE